MLSLSSFFHNFSIISMNNSFIYLSKCKKFIDYTTNYVFRFFSEINKENIYSIILFNANREEQRNVSRSSELLYDITYIAFFEVLMIACSILGGISNNAGSYSLTIILQTKFFSIDRQATIAGPLYPVRTMWTTLPPSLRDGLVLDVGA